MKATVCNRGHEMTPPNLYIHTDGWPRCRACKLETAREYQRKLRQQPGYSLLKKKLRAKYKRTKRATP